MREPWVHYVLWGRTCLPKCLTFECKPNLIAWTLLLQHQHRHQLPMIFGVCHTCNSCSTNTKLQNPAMNSLQIAWIDMLNCLLKKYKVNSIHQTISSRCMWKNPCKVCGCYSATFLNRTPVFDWCVVWQGSKNKHHRDTFLKEIGLHFEVILSTTHSIVNTIGKTYVFNWGFNIHATSVNHN
jgi:hypothetical protein